MSIECGVKHPRDFWEGLSCPLLTEKSPPPRGEARAPQQGRGGWSGQEKAPGGGGSDTLGPRPEGARKSCWGAGQSPTRQQEPSNAAGFQKEEGP